MKLVLAKHGRVEGYSSGVIPGYSAQLCDKGIEEARTLARTLSGVDAIYSSVAPRAVSTTKEILNVHDIPCFYDERLDPMGAGEYEGKNRDEVNWDINPKGGESLDNFMGRTEDFLNSLYSTPEDDCVLVLSHSGNNKILEKIIKVRGFSPNKEQSSSPLIFRTFFIKEI